MIPNCPPHTYGPASLLAFAVRANMADYLAEAKRAKADKRPMARRACVQMALMIRADFRNARIVEVFDEEETDEDRDRMQFPEDDYVSPEQEAREAFNDRYEMYRNEY